MKFGGQRSGELTTSGSTYRYSADRDKYIGGRDRRWDEDPILGLWCLAIADTPRGRLPDTCELYSPIAQALALGPDL
ncbi:hypothetical protein SLA2020_279820 [Shorea laevis]